MIKLVLSIRSLETGGAEHQFIKLVKNIDATKFDITVCTMYGGALEYLVKQISYVKYINLQKNGRYDFYNFYAKYTQLLIQLNPDIIYSFLGEMNLFSLWCKPTHTKIIWGFRSSNMDLSQYGKVSQLIFWLQKKFSSRVDKIIANSHASIKYHTGMGFDLSKAIVIHNGIETSGFKRDMQKRMHFRRLYKLKRTDVAIGIIARIDYMKGYVIFSKAAKILLEKYDNLFFFSVGSGDEKIKQECMGILLNEQRFYWLGNQRDVEYFYSGFDITSSSSFSEGFSNSIAEAMSCECACVVTNVGDSAIIVGEFGIVIDPNSVESLCIGLEKMINSDFKKLGRQSRQRIIENYSIETMVRKTENEILACVV